MNGFTTAIILAALLSAAAQDSSWESKAVTRVQQTAASQYDPSLPSRPFGNWLNQVVGPQSGVSWHLGECVELAEMDFDVEQGIPACVEATAILPDERKVVAQIFVGSFKQGLSQTTKFHFATIEKDNQFQSVRKLSDLPQLLREPFPIEKLNIITLPQIDLIHAPRLSSFKAHTLIGPPKIMTVETGADIPPPPKTAGALRVSSGATAGNALTKVAPIYPPFARQIKASGEVQVAITINEKGLVIEAKAISGHTALRASAEEAAKKWVFRPTRIDGKPMRQQDVLTFIFSLPQ